MTKSQTAFSRTVLTVAASAVLLFSAGAVAEPWATHAGRLPALAKKLSDNEEEIRHLLERKKHLEDAGAIHDLMRELDERHKTLVKTSEEYETERLHVRFKHPDRASIVERQYTHFKLKTVEQLENELGLDGRLDRLKSKVSAIFPAPKPAPKAEPESARKPASVVNDEDAPEAIHLSK